MSSFVKMITGILALGVVACIFILGTTNLNPSESGLLSLILFIFSVLAAWIVTHAYAESAHAKAIEEVKNFHQENLRTYALKAAEKVNNLSRQLSLLSAYIQDELDSEGDSSPPEELLVKEERLASAIQIINILKSVNDTALSDWKGVIGDELEKQEEVREEKEEQIRELMEQLQSVLATEMASLHHRQENTDALRSEIESIRKELRFLVTDVAGASVRRPRKLQPKRVAATSECPICRAPLSYKQRPKPAGFKIVKCESCASRLVSRFDEETGFSLVEARTATETVECPNCQSNLQVELGTLPGSSVVVLCEACRGNLRLSRASDEIRIAMVPSEVHVEELDDETINSIQNSLPPQPWPAGTSKSVARKLGLPLALVNRGVQELIKRGVYKVQIDGTLYVPERQERAGEQARG